MVYLRVNDRNTEHYVTNGTKQVKRHGRRKPYTEAGIRRIPCARCGRPAEHQWNICADGGLKRPTCIKCDILLNQVVLRFMRDPDWKQKIAAYKAGI